MFTNIGGKLKILAKIICYAGISLSALTGLFFMFILSFAVGLLIIAGGALSAYLSSLFIYAFGELVQNSCVQTELAVKHALDEERAAGQSFKSNE